MPSLVLGPLLRHAGETDATVWVETDTACTVTVLGCEQETFCVAGHHYALVIVEGLEPGSVNTYEVHLDGTRVWPIDDAWPGSVIRTITRDQPLDVVFGSCRTAYPHEPPYTLPKDEDERGREVCALRAMALRLRKDPSGLPGALVMLGDQIYADEVDPRTRERIRRRRDTSVPPGDDIADFEEYTWLYHVAWKENPLRWLFSTVPTSMIIDDHDVIDDWNTSLEWLEEIREQDWWDERIVGAFVSYWVYQHIGNLSPEDLRTDPLWKRVCEADDAEPVLREFAWHADREVDSTQWSFARDLGPARLIMVDSRAGRVLDPDKRAMVDDDEWEFIRSNACGGDHDHVLIGTSLPWLLAPGMHHLEAWNEAISGGAWGPLFKKAGEYLRQELDLEHWGAFNDSWRNLTTLIRDVSSTDHAPATVVVLSGDVHHAYLAEVGFRRDEQVRSRVYQAVASPFRNPLDSKERRVIRTASTSAFARVTGAMARSAGVPDPQIGWRLREKAVFDNVVATLRLDGRDARLRIEKASPTSDGDEPQLRTAFEGAL